MDQRSALRMRITVERLNPSTFQVTVAAGVTTTHTVTVTGAYVEKLTGGQGSAEQLVERSFEFLLAREPNTSILRSFELPVIQRYFPEYERTMAGK